MVFTLPPANNRTVQRLQRALDRGLEAVHNQATQQQEAGQREAVRHQEAIAKAWPSTVDGLPAASTAGWGQLGEPAAARRWYGVPGGSSMLFQRSLFHINACHHTACAPNRTEHDEADPLDEDDTAEQVLQVWNTSKGKFCCVTERLQQALKAVAPPLHPGNLPAQPTYKSDHQQCAEEAARHWCTPDLVLRRRHRLQQIGNSTLRCGRLSWAPQHACSMIM